MKSYAEYLAALSARCEAALDERELVLLAGALLDGGVPDVELGALLATLRMRSDSALLMQGLLAALDARVTRFPAMARVAPIVIGCYGGASELPNLTALLALLLARFGVPVLLHGPLHAASGVSSALVLRELAVMPCTRKQQVARELELRHLAFVPDALLAPGLAAVLAFRARLGPVPLLVTAARLIDPFDCGSVVVAAGDDAQELEQMRMAVAGKGMRAVLLPATEGEAFASPLARPRIEYWSSGEKQVLFEDSNGEPRRASALPASTDAKATATWIRQACEGARAVPAPIVNQLAGCLHAVGYCDDFNQAKALAAIAAAGRRVA